MSGFLGFGASFMLDFILLSLVFLAPMVLFGIFLSKRQAYRAHSRWMFSISWVLLVLVCLFELDMRMHGGIAGIAAACGKGANVETPFFSALLHTHLFFSLSCCVLWTGTVWGAWKHFHWQSPAPAAYGAVHRKRAWVSVFFLSGVVVTGVMVYYFAFMAS